MSCQGCSTDQASICQSVMFVCSRTPQTATSSSDHPHGKGQRSGGSSKRPTGGPGTSGGHSVPPPRGFGPVRGGHRGRRDGPQHERGIPANLLLEGTTVKGLERRKDMKRWGCSALRARVVSRYQMKPTIWCGGTSSLAPGPNSCTAHAQPIAAAAEPCRR